MLPAWSGRLHNHQRAQGREQFDGKLFAAKDLKTFEERVWFDAGTFARSFDVIDGALYLGLGCEPSSLHARTGEVVSLAKGSW